MTASQLLYFTDRGSGPPLLLVHGLMATGEMFDHVVERFATRHRVVVPDLRGHGRSRALPRPFTAAQHATDLVNVLDHLGIDAAAIVGYSHGGPVAQQLIFDHVKRCSRLVLACTYAFNMATFRERLEGRVAPLLLRVLGMRRFAKLTVSQGIPGPRTEVIQRLVEMIANQDRDSMISAWRDAMAFDGRPRLGEIRCPTLIVAGSRDNAVPSHHAELLRAGIAGAEQVIVDGAGHGLIWTHPDEFFTAVDQFLSRDAPSISAR